MCYTSYLKKIILVLLLTFTHLFSQSIRIMPLGDSITHGYPNGYRDDLWFKLMNGHYDVNFVGSQYSGSGFDANHEGYGGFKTYDIASFIYNRLQQNPPDIILLHIGSNDVSPTQGVNSSSITGLNQILNQIDYFERDYNHPIKVILASIINRREYHSTVTNYNRNLRNLAYSRIYNGDNISLVNMESGAGLNSNDFADATHPNNRGYSKMATVWFNALNHLLPVPIPSSPNSPSISSITTDRAVLAWNDNSNNELGFRIYKDNVLIATVGENTRSYGLGNLKPRTTYTYIIKSYNSLGESSNVSVTFRTKDDYAWLPAIYSVILND